MANACDLQFHAIQIRRFFFHLASASSPNPIRASQPSLMRLTRLPSIGCSDPPHGPLGLSLAFLSA